MAVNNAFFHHEFESTKERAVEAIEHVLRALVKHDWIPCEEEFGMRLCLEEAIVNAIAHGNQNDPDRKVRIELLEEGDCCKIHIHDEGCGFTPEDITLLEATEKGGRGVCLMKHFMDEVSFNGTKCCLEMTFRRKTQDEGNDHEKH